MNSISQNLRYLPHELKTRENAVKTYRNGNSTEYVAIYYNFIDLIEKFSKRSLQYAQISLF